MPATAIQAQPVRLLLRRGNRLRFTVVVATDGEPVDLTGYTGSLHFREYADSEMPLLALGMASASATGISIDPLTGRVTVHLAPATTATLAFRHAVYDLILTSADGDRLTPIRGELLVSQAVTR